MNNHLCSVYVVYCLYCLGRVRLSLRTDNITMKSTYKLSLPCLASQNFQKYKIIGIEIGYSIRYIKLLVMCYEYRGLGPTLTHKCLSSTLSMCAVKIIWTKIAQQNSKKIQRYL